MHCFSMKTHVRQLCREIFTYTTEKKEKETRKGKWSVTEASNIYNNQELI